MTLLSFQWCMQGRKILMASSAQGGNPYAFLAHACKPEKGRNPDEAMEISLKATSLSY
jgi:hypothetical protein